MAVPRRPSGERKISGAAYQRALLLAQQEASPDGVLVVDPEGRILSYNRRFVEMWRIPAEVIASKDDGRALESVLHQLADPAAFLARVRAVYARPDERSEDLVPLADGRVFERLSSPVIGELGERYGRVWYFRDITDRRRAEEALRESEQRFRQLTENSREVFWLADAVESKVFYITPAWEQVWGRPLPGLDDLPQVWRAALHPEDRERVLAASQRRALGTYDEYYRILRPGGEVRWIRDRAFPVKDADGRVYRVAGLSEDVTERRRLEQELRDARDKALASDHAKSEFLANVSHELRTPLNAVIASNELLLAGALAPEQKERAAVARDAGRDLLALIDDLLDFARLEAGRMILDEAPFEPRALAAEAARLLRHKAEQKGLSLTVSVSGEVPARLVGDEKRLRQVLTNFLGNALKFTESGSVELAVDCPRRDETGALLRLRVRDTGIGIAPEAQPRLFTPFTQADASTTRRYGGTGLGLAICRQIAELMRGRVGLESVPGRGSTFAFEAFLPEAPPAARAARAPADRREDLQGLRVLVVEDNPVNRRVALDQLAALGCAADSAEDGVAALERLAARRYDAVLMDCQMPRRDGYEAARELRRREGSGPRTPVIALTAGARPEDRERCLAAGMDDHLSKPVSLEKLAAALSRWAAPVDPAVLARALETIGEGSVRWRAAYLEDAARLLGEMRAASGRGDAAALRLAAHTLKGASASLGARRLAALCARAEAGELLLSDLAAELETVRRRLTAA